MVSFQLKAFVVFTPGEIGWMYYRVHLDAVERRKIC
jgi:hypothetical protein